MNEAEARKQISHGHRVTFGEAANILAKSGVTIRQNTDLTKVRYGSILGNKVFSKAKHK